MNILLDTHVALWWFDGGDQLSAAAIDTIGRANTVYVSAASAWEVAIKSALGKLSLPAPFEEGVERSKFTRLPITFAHATAISSLPGHHADPFDRMLIAQAVVENLSVVTRDKQLLAYGRPIIWA